MTRPSRTAIVLLALSAAAVAACSTPASRDLAARDPAAAVPLPPLTGTDWRCVELVDADGKAVDLGRDPPTLHVASDGHASGFAGVNRYGCDAEIGNATRPVRMPLSFGPLMATRMAGPPERMALERAFTTMLGSVRVAEIGVGADGLAMLTLRSETGSCARFVAGGPASPRGDRSGG